MTTPRTITVTREQLYAEVWSTPMMRLAKKYEVSDVALAKACERLDVPRPPRGYWIRLEFGKAPAKPPLPKRGAGIPEATEINPPAAQPAEPVCEFKPRPVAARRPASLKQCRPVLHATRAALLKWSPDEDGRLRGSKNAKGVFKLSVTRETLDRAQCILEGVIRACEAQGWKVVPGDEHPKMTVLDGEADVDLRIIEPVTVTREKHPEFSWQTNTYSPTGVLRLEIESYCTIGAPKAWNDSKDAPISDKLSEIVASIGAALAFERARREQWAEERRCREEREKIEAERAKAASAERARTEQLLKECANWRSAMEIRAFCEEVERRVDPPTNPAVTEQWLTWARHVADQRDPFLSGYFQHAVDAAAKQKAPSGS